MNAKKSYIRLGPGAASLILIFVVLSMAVLGMLSLMTARSDLRLSERSAEVAEAVYALQARAETRRMELDGLLTACAEKAGDGSGLPDLLAEALPEDVALEGDLLSWTETDGMRTLLCALRVSPPGSAQRTVWVRSRLISAAGMADAADEEDQLIDD